jgi:ABC-type phosphate transport system auxiliary subunit
MSFWSAIVLIVLITAAASVIRSRHRGGGRLSHHQEIQSSAREKQLQDEVEQLRDRIQVLERIATDGNSIDAQETRRIAAEIENLRHAQDKQES